MRIYPAIDLRDGRCVRLRQGDYAQETRFADDPAAVAEQFAADGAEWLHVVDLDAAKLGEPTNTAAVAEIVRRARLPVQLGGGVRSAESARRWLSLGVARVVVGTRAVEDWDGFAKLAREPDLLGRVALGLDSRDGRLAVRGWLGNSELTALELARRAEPLGLAALIVTDIARDGMMAGPNLEHTRALAEAVATPIVHSGGVTTLADVAALAALRIHGAIIGRALYEGGVDLAAAILAGAEQLRT